MAKTAGILTLAAVLFVAGCGGQQQPQAGRVAVLSLDRIADQLGRKAAIDEEFRSRSQSIEQTARAELQQLQQQFQQAQQRVGAQPTDADKQHLAEVQGQIAQRVQQLQQEVQRQEVAVRAELITKFREQVTPVAQQVADEMGLSIVLVQGDFILFTAPACDITDAVIERMKTEAPAAPAAAAPAPAAPANP